MNSQTLRVAIADDEPLARLRLQQLCDDVLIECPNTVVGSYAHGAALIQALASQARAHLPDVLLLDINMPGLSGLEVAAALNQYAPATAVVFVSAEPEHALAAFELSAVDYVLKPVRAERLLKAFQKARAWRLSRVDSAKPQSNMIPTAPQLLVHGELGLQSIGLDEVLYFKAEQKMTLVRTLKAQFTCTQSLAELEVMLLEQMTNAQEIITSTQAFIRIHRNALLRISAIGGVSMLPEAMVQVNGLSDTLQVSRRMLPDVLKWLA